MKLVKIKINLIIFNTIYFKSFLSKNIFKFFLQIFSNIFAINIFPIFRFCIHTLKSLISFYICLFFFLLFYSVNFHLIIILLIIIENFSFSILYFLVSFFVRFFFSIFAIYFFSKLNQTCF